MQLFDAKFAGLERVLDLRVQQHAITASNLANAETPMYRAKVIGGFDKRLEEAMAGEGPEILASDPRHIGYAEAVPALRIEELEPDPWVLDGNSVVGEQEVGRLRSNATLYSAVAKGLSKRFALLKYAASNGR
jgi:flagellar basal-body rod protein FlgB